ncbi:MAG TPA: phosphate ABC transporter permease PstA [Mycobacteriales bacterium]|nr:phosphate ABC transporter permease PstA [Mycobacteriales bacterium]
MTLTAPRAPERTLQRTSKDGRRVAGERAFQLLLLIGLGIGLVVLGVLLYTVANKGGGRLSSEFMNGFPSRRAAKAGIKPALYGSLWLLGLTIVIAVPLSIGAAIWLEEIAPRNWLTRLIEVNIANLAGVPSIVYGILAAGLFSGLLGLGDSLWTGAFALSMLAFPVIVVAARESIRAVPPSIRQGAYALGATRWQVTRRSVLPPSIGGVVTGCVLALSRAIGEAAPLLLVAVTASFSTPNSPGDVFSALPLQIYSWTTRPQVAFQVNAAAAIMVLLGIVLTVNVIAIFIRNRSQVRW